jgi:predicted acyltransferase
MAESTTIAPAVPASGPQTTASPAVSQRLMSVDALRGFDMFWIVGAEEIFHALNEMFKSQPMPAIMNQLEHREWEGFHFEDFIFPLFVFLMGVAAVFSLTKLIQTEGRPAAVKRIIRRFVLMFVLALIYSGGFSKNWPDMRLMGVLNRIALCYLFGGLIFCFFKPKAIAAIAVGLLLGYWALLAWVPFPDVRPTPGIGILNRTNAPTIEQVNMASTNLIHGSYVQGVNLTDYLDQKYLPGRRYDGTYDPEGFLSTMPAIVTCLLGIFAGLLLKNANVPPTRKVITLLSFGVAGVLLGYLWGMEFPIIKKIWSSSYVLVAGGYSAIALGIFYWIVDVMKFQAWCQPFVWMGMNSITIYLIHGFIVSFPKLSTRLVGGDIADFLNAKWIGLGDLLIAVVAMALTFWFLRFLYRRKIFLRL